MFLVDTDVLVYAVNTNADLHTDCRALLERWRHRPSIWCLAWPIIYEFLRVVTHPRVMEKPIQIADGWAFVQAILASPGLQIIGETDGHERVASEFFSAYPTVSGNLVFDARIAVLMIEHGLQTIVTEDTDFHHFREITRVSPRDAADL